MNVIFKRSTAFAGFTTPIEMSVPPRVHDRVVLDAESDLVEYVARLEWYPLGDGEIQEPVVYVTLISEESFHRTRSA